MYEISRYFVIQNFKCMIDILIRNLLGLAALEASLYGECRH